MLARVEPWLKRNNVEYKVYTGEDIPDEMPHGYVFKGHKSRRHLACLVTKLDSEALHAAIEKMLDMRDEDIQYLQAFSGKTSPICEPEKR